MEPLLLRREKEAGRGLPCKWEAAESIPPCVSTSEHSLCAKPFPRSPARAAQVSGTGGSQPGSPVRQKERER